MGAFLAIASIFGLLYAKKYAAALAAGGSTAGPSSDLTVIGEPDPNEAYDTRAPFQGAPIGNTFLSSSDPVYNTAGEVVALPYRPADPAYGGGISDLAEVEQDPNPAGSPGSGISAIEKLNAPHARAPIFGGVGGFAIPTPRLPITALYRRVREKPVASPRAGDSGAGKLPFVPAAVQGLPNRHPQSPLRPTIAIRHPGIATTSQQLQSAPNQPAARGRVVHAKSSAPARRSQIVRRGARFFAS